MGNSASKRAQRERLDAAEIKYNAAKTTLLAREKVLAQLEKDLEISRTHQNNAASTASNLRDQVQELNTQLTTVQQRSQDSITKLQEELKLKNEEIQAEQQVVELRMRERDAAVKDLDQLGGDLKELEQGYKTLSGLISLQNQQVDAAKVAAKDLQKAKEESNHLYDRIKGFELSNRVLTHELLAVRTKTADDIAVVKANAASDLVTLQNAANNAVAAVKDAAIKQLDAANLSFARKMNTLSYDLTSTKAALSAAQAELETLKRTSNIAIDEKIGGDIYTTPDHVKFSVTRNKDIRIRIGHWEGETRVDIREFWRSGNPAPTKKGLSIPVKDAIALARILPDVVKKAAEVEQGR